MYISEAYTRERERSPCALNQFLSKRGGDTMPIVKQREGEAFETVMKRFKKQCEKAGIMSEVRKRESYEKPSVRIKKKRMAARKRALKKMKKVTT